MDESEKCYSVYLHKSPSGKMYFGITSNKPKIRWNHGNGYRGNKHFWKAILKYGWDSFEHIVIASGLTEREACDMEVSLIFEHHTNDPNYGYNLSRGGEGVYDRCGENNTNYRHGMCVGGHSKEYKHICNQKSYQAHRDERLARQNLYGAEHREHKRLYDKIRYWERKLADANTEERKRECNLKLAELRECVA